MGIENREYMRDESSPIRRGRSDHPWLQNIIKTLIIVNVIVLVLQVVTRQPMSFEEFAAAYGPAASEDPRVIQSYRVRRQTGQLPQTSVVEDWFMLDSQKVLYGQIWRLTTYDFLHSTQSLWHIFFNMFVLFLAGRRVADRYGHWEFLWFYLASGVFSAAFYIGWGIINNEHAAAVGASGAVAAVLVLYAMNWPHHKWYIYGIIPVPAYLLVLISAGMDLFPMLQQLSGGGRTDNIAHAAHIGGMLFGFLYYKSQWVLSSYVPQKLSFSTRRKPKLRVHSPVDSERDFEEPARQPIPRDVEERVDSLLAKISQSGQDSLSSDEREFLAESSRKYRR